MRSDEVHSAVDGCRSLSLLSPRNTGNGRRGLGPRIGRGLATVGVGLAMAFGMAAEAPAKTLVGSPGPDRLVGKSPAGDILYGGGGADTLIGGPGNSIIYGVRSGNRITVGDGSNYIQGGSGDDIVVAGNGNNTIYTGSGHDKITAGDGNNYVDSGGAPDQVTLGNGNNVLHTGSGGGTYQVGNGNNTIYYVSGPAHIVAGTGVNIIYVNTASAVGSVDCGGNPQSTIYINPRLDMGGVSNDKAIATGRIKNCPNIVQEKGPQRIKSRSASTWGHISLDGDGGNDKLFGGHGGGTINGGGGNNVLWADKIKASGGAKARSKTTTITAANGDNQIYGGRGTNIVTVGSGRNLIRGGAGDNRITTHGGDNVVRLQGAGRNTVTFHGGSNYVESFTRGSVPRVRCLSGAKAIVLYGRVKPKTNCHTRASAYSKKGKKLQVQGVEPIPDSDSAVEGRPRPGDNGIGVPPPAPKA